LTRVYQESYFYLNSPQDGTPQENNDRREYHLQIHDLRELDRNEYGLDKTGFGFEKVTTSMTEEDWYNDQKIKETYYQEVIKWASSLRQPLIVPLMEYHSYLKGSLGAHTVQIFDHTIRRLAPIGVTIPDTPSTRQPLHKVHVDQSDTSARGRVKMHMPERDIEKLLSERFQIINVWRPFHTVSFAMTYILDC
jgi:hypothetical protein